MSKAILAFGFFLELKLSLTTLSSSENPGVGALTWVSNRVNLSAGGDDLRSAAGGH